MTTTRRVTAVLRRPPFLKPSPGRRALAGCLSGSDAACGGAFADLVSRMTLEEKASMMENTTPGVPRLAIPKYNCGARHCTGSQMRAMRPSSRKRLVSPQCGMIPYSAKSPESSAWKKSQVQQLCGHGKGGHDVPRTHLLVAQHQHISRSSLGARAGNVWRGSLF